MKKKKEKKKKKKVKWKQSNVRRKRTDDDHDHDHDHDNDDNDDDDGHGIKKKRIWRMVASDWQQASSKNWMIYKQFKRTRFHLLSFDDIAHHWPPIKYDYDCPFYK